MSKIVFIGDSITKGTDYAGVTTIDTFAYKIGTANGYAASDISNKGVASDTSSGVLARLQNDVISMRPGVCVLMIGVNDWKTGVPVDQYTSNVQQILRDLKSASIKPVVMSSVMYRGTNAQFASWKPYLEALENVCASEGVDCIDVYREFTYATYYAGPDVWKAYYFDQIHLAKAGHTFVAGIAARDLLAGVFTVQQ